MARPISKTKAAVLQRVKDGPVYAYREAAGQFRIKKASQAISTYLLDNDYLIAVPVQGENGYYCQEIFLSDKGEQALQEYRAAQEQKDG